MIFACLIDTRYLSLLDATFPGSSLVPGEEMEDGGAELQI